jgi:hypothetical protein
MAAALVAAVVFAALRPRAPSGYTPPTDEPTATADPAPTPELAPPPELPDLTAAIARVEAEYQVALGVALAEGTRAAQATMQVWQGGTLRSGLAWQTIDIPMAIALLAQEKQPQSPGYLLERAIADASTAGDEAIWQWLGDQAEANAKTEAVLRAGGDPNTTLPVGGEGYPVLSQTVWALADQARFAGALSCMPNASEVTYRMAVVSDFGLSLLQRTYAKSGWGADPNGAVSVRQLGIMLTPTGDRMGVALAAVALDGTAATAQAALTALAPLIQSAAQGISGHC